MTLPRIILVTLWFSTLLAETHADIGSLPSSYRLSANVMVCKVDPTQVIRTIPRAIYGTNLEWFNNADRISDANGNVDPKFTALATSLGVANIRFPGGTLSDFYHWKDGTGPESARPTRQHPTDTGASANVFGTPDLLRFCAAIGAEPLITVNAGTADETEAAAWVSYCNQNTNAARIADGVASAARVNYWEVGNELYLAGNPTDQQKITITPDVYASRFLTFATAMRQVDPSIKLMAIGTANAGTVQLPYPTWSDVVLSKAAAQMDYYAVHNSYFPMIFGQTGLQAKAVYQSLWAAPEAVNQSLTALDALITKYQQSRRIEIAITEWNCLFSNEADWIDHPKTIGSGIYLARLLQVYLGQPRVTFTNFFKFTDHANLGAVAYDASPKVPFYVLQLYAQHFGTQLVGATITSPTFDSTALGYVPAETKVPELTVAASLSSDGKKLYVNVVNRSWQTIHQIKIDPGSFAAANTITCWSISSPGVTDHNGRDFADDIGTISYTEPPVSSSAKLPIQIQKTTRQLNVPLLLPPYSVSTFELDTTS